MIKMKNWSSYQSYKDRKPPWIRLHKSLLDDYDYQSMSVNARALLPMLWLLASEHADPTSGIIEDNIKKISFRLRVSEEEIKNGILEIEAAGFIEQNQEVAESVTKPLQNRNETVTPETETEAEAETETEAESIYVLEKENLDDAVKKYNLLAKEYGLSVVQKMTTARKSKLRARLKDCGGIDGWSSALQKITESQFLLGNETKWKVDFDFILTERGFTKLMEDGYKTYQSKGITNDNGIYRQAEKLLEKYGSADDD